MITLPEPTPAQATPRSPPVPPLPGWEGVLATGERILWQGRTLARLRLGFRSPFGSLFFLFFIGFSVFWMWGASRAGSAFWMFGLFFFAVGAYQLVGQRVWAAGLRSRTRNTRTDQRAFIAIDRPGSPTLKSCPIGTKTVLDLTDGDPGWICVASSVSADGSGRLRTERIGFELIDNCRAVYAKFREAQGRP